MCHHFMWKFGERIRQQTANLRTQTLFDHPLMKVGIRQQIIQVGEEGERNNKIRLQWFI